MKKELERFIFRTWLYFRIGHGTYFAYLMGFMQWIIVIYTLYISSSPLRTYIPHLSTFIAAFSFPYLITASLVGYLHYKRTRAFSSEVEVGLEANPYTFQIVPQSKEYYLMPYQILQVKGLMKLMKKLDVLTKEDETAFDNYIGMLEHLISGKDVRQFQNHKA